jgi:hypothetical protein
VLLKPGASTDGLVVVFKRKKEENSFPLNIQFASDLKKHMNNLAVVVVVIVVIATFLPFR